MSVIVGRALPDVRDGLKPVHRRILYAMYEDGLTRGQALPQVRHRRRRRARPVPPPRRRFGVRRARPPGAGLFACATRSSTATATSAPWTATPRRPTVTPRRVIARISDEMLRDIDKDTVDWDPNFDETTQRAATCCPRRFPQPARQRLLAASPSAWQRTSRRTTCARSSAPASCVLDNPDADARRSHGAISRAPTSRRSGIIMGRSRYPRRLRHGPRQGHHPRAHRD